MGWHQDGITEHLTEGQTLAVWLGLTRMPRLRMAVCGWCRGSHRLGMLSHWSRKTRDELANSSMSEPRRPAPPMAMTTNYPSSSPRSRGRPRRTLRCCDEGGGDEFPPPLARFTAQIRMSPRGPGSGSRQRIRHLDFTRTATPSPWCGEVLARSPRSSFRASQRISRLRKQSLRIARQAANSCMLPVRAGSRCDEWRSEIRVPYRPTLRGTPCEPPLSFGRDPNMEPGAPGLRRGAKRPGARGRGYGSHRRRRWLDRRNRRGHQAEIWQVGQAAANGDAKRRWRARHQRQAYLTRRVICWLSSIRTTSGSRAS